ncbi:DUF2141 domain-containing protein [Novosphingobium clariflavum]|uniref:DUF2141 domain-containing protein n=1 Tax=Novosphingobium clariflavum TaxID=2029884 RepID=A0ABV6S4T8_9SPHN
MRNRPGAVAALIGGAVLACGAAAGPTQVGVTVTGLRSHKGQILACLTTNPRAFPDCSKDPQARKLTVALSGSGETGPVRLDFGAVPQGRYAISLIHDENGNGRLDTTMAIPREGYGFSRDAPVRMGPPRFDKAAFDLGAAAQNLDIRMRYLL